MSHDYLMRQIEDMTRNLATFVVQRKLYKHEEVLPESQFSGENFLFYRLKRMISDGEIQEAEELLFATLKASPSNANLQVALDFYEELQELSDAKLAACRFSRQQIADGLSQLEALYQI